MEHTDGVISSVATKLFTKLAIPAILVCTSVYMTETAIYLCTTAVLLWYGYDSVDGDNSRGFGSAYFNSALGVLFSLHVYLPGTSLWFEFYGLQLIIMMAFSIYLLHPLLRGVSSLVVASIVYGNLEAYNNEIKAEKMKRHPDPYGDDYAQEILDSQNDT